MRYIGLLFAILGIGLHFRMLGWVLDPQLVQSMATKWSLAPIENRLLMVGAMIIPFAYYASCIYACTAKHRSRNTTILILITVIFAAPYFYNLDATLPMIAKNALWAAFFSFPQFLAKSKSKSSSLAAKEVNS